MAKYTTQVRSICEYYAGYSESGNYSTIDATITAAIPNIFTDAWPIYNESHRVELETKILKHYYFMEIGFETVAQWKFYLNTTLGEIMPYYNQLYASTEFEFDPLNTIDWTELRTASENVNETENTRGSDTETGSSSANAQQEVSGNNSANSQETASGNSNSNTNQTNTTSGSTNTNSSYNGTENVSSSERYSDTPQGGLTGIENDTYLTDATLRASETENENSTNTTQTDQSQQTLSRQQTDTSEQSTTRQQTGQSTQNTTRSDSTSRTATRSKEDNTTRSRDLGSNTSITYKGRNNKSPAELIAEYRKLILNIDLMIIKDLQSLFMQIW